MEDHERERRLVLNSVGPVWDGNEVWLITGTGTLFAAFPSVYATVFSGLYLAMMLLLAALITRAVSMEFRSKEPGTTWRRFWDAAFALGSFLPALLLGVALGNLMRGQPLRADGEFAGTFLGLLNPFSLLVGALARRDELLRPVVTRDRRSPSRRRRRDWARWRLCSS